MPAGQLASRAGERAAGGRGRGAAAGGADALAGPAVCRAAHCDIRRRHRRRRLSPTRTSQTPLGIHPSPGPASAHLQAVCRLWPDLARLAAGVDTRAVAAAAPRRQPGPRRPTRALRPRSFKLSASRLPGLAAPILKFKLSTAGNPGHGRAAGPGGRPGQNGHRGTLRGAGVSRPASESGYPRSRGGGGGVAHGSRCHSMVGPGASRACFRPGLGPPEEAGHPSGRVHFAGISGSRIPCGRRSSDPGARASESSDQGARVAPR